MRLLLFSDLHCDLQAAERLVARSRDFDALVGAGDFGASRRGVGVCFEVLRTIERPAVIVPGNNESLDELTEAAAVWPSARVLHGAGCAVDGVAFFGLGGGVPTTPFGAWSWDFSEDAARELLAAMPSGAVLVTHSPPWGTLDHGPGARPRGSVAVREAVDAKSPPLVVCGHIHACGGQWDAIGSSWVVNAGPDGVAWNLERGEPS